MINLDLNSYGVQELDAKEINVIDGGKVAYLKTQWSGTNNSLCYAMEAVANGCIEIANGGIWLWNACN